MRLSISTVLAIAALAGCGGVSPNGAGETTPGPAAPVEHLPGEPVSFIELLPTATNGLALLQVARLRAHSHGPAFTNMVRRIGVYDWEQAVGVDLRTDVEQLAVFGIADERQGPGDLTQVLQTLQHASLGGVVELRSEAVSQPECTDAMLAELAAAGGTTLSAAAAGFSMFRCGRFVIIRPVAVSGSLGPFHQTPVAAALEAIFGTTELGGDVVFVALASPDMVDRVSCGEGTVSLAGWQHTAIELAAGMTLRGRYHAAPGEDLALLERCVSDGMGGFANVPLFAQLELGDVLQNAAIQRDQAQERDVTLEATFSESELDLMLGLLELVGSGIQD